VDPRDQVLSHGWILYKDGEEIGNEISISLAWAIDENTKKGWYSSGLRAQGWPVAEELK